MPTTTAPLPDGLARRAPGRAAPGQPPPVQPARALWVWDVSTPAATVALAAGHGIGRLFVAVPARLSSSPELPAVRELSERAGSAGIRVDALGGDPGWVEDPSRAVDGWLRPAVASGLFTGVHVDIEPYACEGWRSDRAGLVDRYLDTLAALARAAGSLPLEADIPFWFHEVPTRGATLDREVLARTAGVSVMAYRNTAGGEDGTVALAGPALEAARSAGKPARVGQETTRLGGSAADARQTFHGQTRTAMEAQLAKVDAAFAAVSSYAGIAVHDARGYAAMAP